MLGINTIVEIIKTQTVPWLTAAAEVCSHITEVHPLLLQHGSLVLPNIFTPFFYTYGHIANRNRRQGVIAKGRFANLNWRGEPGG